ncbi:MAG: DNA polymerase III subunit epsilon [Bifidobacteriaceae bacterium]|jgi:DNA polymerase-3 subunit epsilon|nr:DNA polymerase III subunit epsilon [Bifidobacteriaceae bacterium]
MRQLVGFDTETTGVYYAQDRVVTAALVHRAADGTERTRTWLIDPGVEIPQRATAIHGITTAKARAEGQDAAEALEEIAAELAGALAQGVPVLAFNASFDLRILQAELKRREIPTLADRLGGPVAPVIDPLLIDRGVDRYRRGKRKLGDLIEVYRLPVSDNLHDALEDVRQAIAVFDAIETRHPQIAALDAADLHLWQVPKQREWAEGFNKWLAKQGRPADADPLWP